MKIGPEAETAVDALAEALKDPDPSVRGWAAQALGQIGPKATAAVPALTEALKDKDPYIREMAAEALRKIEAER
jgi:HEAT repeat protein